MNFWIDVILKVVTAVAATSVAIYVAQISKRQWMTNQEKLRFDLYQRRYEIYLRVLDYHLALLEWQDEHKLAVTRGPFHKAISESKFLFPRESGIYDFLVDYDAHAARVCAYKGRTDLSGDERSELSEDQKWFRDRIATLEEKLGPFLSFQSI